METITATPIEPKAEPKKPVLVREESALERRARLLNGLDPVVIRRAWFALSHVFLDDDAFVADMGCGDGAATYAMAALRPKVRFVGIDKDRRAINKARETYSLPNLTFKVGDIAEGLFKPETLDCIINSYTLHAVYSGFRYNEKIVQDTLEHQMNALKKNGFLFIRDFARPPPDEFVLIEMPDTESVGDDITVLSEPDFLIWYSENARPRNDPGTGGFFLEELPARVPKTRLFRLPYKWAYEFILRKDDREAMQRNLHVEYTFFTRHEFRKILRNMGARVRYSGPYWDDDVIEKRFEGRFKLYMDDGTPLGNPPTCFVAVSQKMAERKSLNIEERRPSSKENSKLMVSSMRDSKTGKIADIVTREERSVDILPYRVDEDGFLKIYLHDGVARSIANAVVRSGENIHGKRWSGHMIETIAVNEDLVIGREDGDGSFDAKFSALLGRDHLGLKPTPGSVLKKGPGYFPAPDFIAEYIHTFYLEVQKASSVMTPKPSIMGLGRFQAKGKIREFDAQQVLDAISLGMIPNAKLELQIMALFKHTNIEAESWVNKKVNIKAGEITGNADLAKIMTQLKASQTRFKDIKGSAGDLRSINSVFVEEGHTRGALSGLSAQEEGFVVHDHETVNRAVVLPLTKNMKEEVHAGFLIESLPVPEKLEGKCATISCPTFELPRHITNNRLARKYVAEKFAVLPEMVIKMGEPYYCHVSVTPQKIYPFAVAVPPDFMEDPDVIFLPAYQLALLNRRNDLNKSTHMMSLIGRSFKYMSDDVYFDAKYESKMTANMERAFDGPDWGFPLSYNRPSFLKEGGEESASTPRNYSDLKAGASASPRKSSAPFHERSVETNTPVTATERNTDNAPDIGNNFTQEVKEFLDELEQMTGTELRPEKW